MDISKAKTGFGRRDLLAIVKQTEGKLASPKLGPWARRKLEETLAWARARLAEAR